MSEERTTAEVRKEFALQHLAKRKRDNANKKRVDNRALRAESPMYYYCEECGWQMALPESHVCPVPKHCHECEFLKSQGWIE